MSTQLVTVATFNFATDPNLLLLKAKLADNGIAYNAADENTIGIDPLLSISVGGIRVLVNEQDAARAREIIQEINDINQESREIVDFEKYDEPEDNVSFEIITPDTGLTPSNTNSTYLIIVGALAALLVLALLFTVLREL